VQPRGVPALPGRPPGEGRPTAVGAAAASTAGAEQSPGGARPSTLRTKALALYTCASRGRATRGVPAHSRPLAARPQAARRRSTDGSLRLRPHLVRSKATGERVRRHCSRRPSRAPTAASALPRAPTRVPQALDRTRGPSAACDAVCGATTHRASLRIAACDRACINDHPQRLLSRAEPVRSAPCIFLAVVEQLRELLHVAENRMRYDNHAPHEHADCGM